MFKIKDNKRRSEAYSLTMSLRNHGLTQKQIAEKVKKKRGPSGFCILNLSLWT